MESEKVKRDLIILELFDELGQPLSQQSLKKLLVNQDTEHVGVVVQRKNALDGLCHHPKCVLLVHAGEQFCNNEVHSLAVANGWVPLDIAVEDPSQDRDIFLELDLVPLLGVGAPQVKFDLLERRVRIEDLALC